jgi:hypothetical protein
VTISFARRSWCRYRATTLRRCCSIRGVYSREASIASVTRTMTVGTHLFRHSSGCSWLCCGRSSGYHWATGQLAVDFCCWCRDRILVYFACGMISDRMWCPPNQMGLQ